MNYKDKKTRLIKWQRITILILSVALIVTIVHLKSYDRLREAAALEKSERLRQEREAEVEIWKRAAREDLDSVMEIQKTMEEQYALLDKYRKKYGRCEEPQRH